MEVLLIVLFCILIGLQVYSMSLRNKQEKLIKELIESNDRVIKSNIETAEEMTNFIEVYEMFKKRTKSSLNEWWLF